MNTATLTRPAITLAAAHRELREEFNDAFRAGNGQALIRTPGFKPTRQPLADVLSDDMGGVNSDALWNELVSILSGAAQGEDVQLRAAVFVARAAKRHADFHADDLVQQLEEGN